MLEKPIVIFAGVHPDDLELSCGGSISRFVEYGYNVMCVFLTKGECGGSPAVRVKESINACIKLGVNDKNILFGDFKDTKVPETHRTIAFLERFCNRNVFAAFIPSVNEEHQDHRHTANSCITAFRHVPRVFSYESPSTNPKFSPNTFVDVTGHVRKKWLALRCHKSQWKMHKIYMEYRSMLKLAAFRGSQAGVKFAEAFETVRNLLELSPVTNLLF